MPISQVQDWGEATMASFAGAMALFFSGIPRIIGFLLILIIGWFVAGAVIWFFAGFPFARSAPQNIRTVVEAVHFQDSTAIERAVPRDAIKRAALEAIARDKRAAPPDFWPF